MISDTRKGLFLQYNYLNLLQKAAYYENMPDGGRRLIQSANYTWLADGTKASVVDKDGNGYSYLGSLTYKRSADGSLKLESATHGSGRIVVRDDPESSDNSGNNGNTGSSDNSDDTGHSENPNAPTKRLYENQYYITDHLGSVRVVFNQQGEVLARNDYYPFGKPHDNPALTAATTSGTSGASGTSGTSTNPADNRFLYNGKENQLTGNLGFLDYGWRMYDKESGRWFGPDKLAENYCFHSPYVFTADNPLKYVDFNGMTWVDPTVRDGLAQSLQDRIDNLNKENFYILSTMVAKFAIAGGFGSGWAGAAAAIGKGTDLYDKMTENLLQIDALRWGVEKVWAIDNSTYMVNASWGGDFGPGYVSQNSNGVIEIVYPETVVLIHEMGHVYDYITDPGKYTFFNGRLAPRSPIFYPDWGRSEINSYSLQYAYSPRSLPQSTHGIITSITGITYKWIGSITAPDGSYPYKTIIEAIENPLIIQNE